MLSCDLFPFRGSRPVGDTGRNPAGAMMTAPIAVAGSALEPGTPVRLFASHIYGGGVDAQQGRQYEVAPDRRFFINTKLENAAAPITALMNWQGGRSARENR